MGGKAGLLKGYFLVISLRPFLADHINCPPGGGWYWKDSKKLGEGLTGSVSLLFPEGMLFIKRELETGRVSLTRTSLGMGYSDSSSQCSPAQYL